MMPTLIEQGIAHEDTCLPRRCSRHHGHGADIERCRDAKARGFTPLVETVKAKQSRRAKRRNDPASQHVPRTVAAVWVRTRARHICCPSTHQRLHRSPKNFSARRTNQGRNVVWARVCIISRGFPASVLALHHRIRRRPRKSVETSVLFFKHITSHPLLAVDT